jgi:hypothetical protein
MDGFMEDEDILIVDVSVYVSLSVSKISKMNDSL